MATLHPFKAVRPIPSHAERIASVPYDVISVAEARVLAQDNALSFLHVIRPEIDLDEGIGDYDDLVYQKGAANLNAFTAGDYTIQESEPSLYVYRQVMNGRHQSGIFSCVAVAEYDDDTILKHEKTRPVKEDDRTRHIVEQSAHAEPVMLTYRDDPKVSQIVRATQETSPLYDFTAVDGVQHTVWKVKAVDDLVEAFKAVEKLYVADGHHRCKAASRAAETDHGQGTYGEINFFPAVVFPMSEMAILPYNRIIKSLPSDSESFVSKLGSVVDLSETSDTTPEEPGDVCFYINRKWYCGRLPEPGSPSAVSSLDVARLGEHVLEPLLGITDPRTDSNIDFVGGIRGTDELVRLVDSGQAALGISMYPTSIQQLIDVSDANQLMPPKSTWFEPKLRSGLLVHLF